MPRESAKPIMVMMLRRVLLLAAGSALVVLLGATSMGTSATKAGRISAHLTSTSFTPARAGKVKVVYRFSSKSTRFAYVLSRKNGTAWTTLRRVSKRGSFRGSHAITIKGLFGSKPVVAGRYRVKLSSSANSVTLGFTVTNPRSAKPETGHWISTSLSGPVSGAGGSTNPGDSVTATSIFFDVVSGGASISGFGFNYHYSGPGTTPGTSCSGSRSTTDQTAAPITNGRFSTPAQNSWSDASYGTFSGTFDSPTRAHGTAWLRGWIGALDCRLSGFANTGEFAWAAVRQP